MANVEAVAVGETRNHLAKYADSFRFRKTAVLTYMIKELAAFDEFQDKVPSSCDQSSHSSRDAINVDSQFTPVLPDIIKTNDIRMLNELHNHHLPLNAQWNRAFVVILKHCIHNGQASAA